MPDVVTCTKDGVVATVTISRPPVNAMSWAVMSELATTFEALAKDRSVKAIVLTGAGENFSAGVDLSSMLDIFNGPMFKDYVETYWMERSPQPIIAAVDGVAITGGFELVLNCDMVVATSRANFQDTHAVFGIKTVWGLSVKLPRLVGPNRAREFSLGAQPLTATRAKEWGLVNEIVDKPEDLLRTAQELAATIASNRGARSYKQSINSYLDLDMAAARKAEIKDAVAFYGSEGFQQMASAMAPPKREAKL